MRIELISILIVFALDYTLFSQFKFYLTMSKDETYNSNKIYYNDTIKPKTRFLSVLFLPFAILKILGINLDYFALVGMSSVLVLTILNYFLVQKAYKK